MTKPQCKTSDCDRTSFARGMCSRCYQRARNRGELGDLQKRTPQPDECSMDDCKAPAKARGLCRAHYARQWRHGDPAIIKKVRHDPICGVSDCGKKHQAHGYCAEHYNRWKRHGDPHGGGQSRERNLGKTCSGPECTRPATVKGLCGTHDMQKRTAGELTPIRVLKPLDGHCEVGGCDRPRQSEGLCQTHYRRRLRGDSNWNAPIVRRAAHGEGHVDKHGYRLISVNGRQVREHRHIAEQILGRPLPPNVDVHHWNINRSDNSTDGPFVDDGNGNLRSGNLVIWLHKKGQPRGGEAGPVLTEARRRIASGEADDQDRLFVEEFGDLMPNARPVPELVAEAREILALYGDLVPEVTA